jgi:aminoglycoside phosphotransferase (APT) family kinase protein
MQPRDSLAERLLRYLRADLLNEGLSYAEPPMQLTGGFDTSIYSFRLNGASDQWSPPLILRLFRADAAPDQAAFEQAVQNAVMSLGYPAPRVLAACGEHSVLGSAFTIMDRVPGQLMLERIVRPSRGWLSVANTLASLHGRLHALDAQAFEAALARDGLPRDRLSVRVDTALIHRELERLALDALRPGLRWLIDNKPAAPGRVSICHGDFHPLNILMEGRSVSGVIDWSWASVAEPAYDIGATVAIFAQGPVDLPAILRPVANFVRRRFIRDYLRSYSKQFPIDLDDVRYFEALRTLGFLIEANEHVLVEAGRAPRPTKPSAFTAPDAARSITRRFNEITGLTLPLPAGLS